MRTRPLPLVLVVLVACSGDDTSASDAASGTAAGTDESAAGTSTTASTDASTGPNTSGTSGSSGTSTSASSDTATTGDPTGDPPGPGSTVPVGGGDYFLLGANYPWKSYGGDFGANNWGTYGVHTKGDEIGGELNGLAADRMRVIRWFVLTDGRAGVAFDAQGTPTGLGEHVFEDMDEALARAEAAGVYLVPVLLDFSWVFWASQDNGVQMGGHTDTIDDPAKRAALVDAVIVPLLDRYADAPAILAWEIMNEPEWVIADIPDPAVDGKAAPIALADFYALAADVAGEVHARTGAYVTLGSACLKWSRVWTPAYAAAHDLPALDLDFYQAHYYPWMDGLALDGHPELGTVDFSPTVQDYAPLGLDRPLVIGELALSSDAGATLDTLKSRGWAGAWPWSLNADFAIDGPGVKAWAEGQGALVDLPAP
ncbi:MAG: hypothetical protein H6710_17720 [Myxococcales bacterium]|nr:hypothetical protein [Myxococcales bacterium]